jgi:formiminotetrahydrofolate cyclodeaminase
MALAGAEGAAMNVLINLASQKDSTAASTLRGQAIELLEKTRKLTAGTISRIHAQIDRN